MFRIRALPAANGDAILLEYGASPVRRVLIDGGTQGSTGAVLQRLQELGVRRLELLVVTHVDTDHIGGALPLIERDDLGVEIARVWFNGFTHLTPPRPKDRLGAADRLGPVHGERLTAALVKRVEAKRTTWNAEFDGGTVVAGATTILEPDDREPLRLTVLSPTWDKLKKLVPKWKPLVQAGGLVGDARPKREEEGGSDRLGAPRLDVERLAATPPGRDSSDANGSSIALLAEYGKRRVLLAGDAHPDVLVPALQGLPEARRELDLFKLPHHGSASNVTAELVKAVSCLKYLFSTNGEGFKNPHPHLQAVSRVVVHGGENPELIFNYKVKTNIIWSRPLPKIGNNARYCFTPTYGDGGEAVVSWRG